MNNQFNLPPFNSTDSNKEDIDNSNIESSVDLDNNDLETPLNKQAENTEPITNINKNNHLGTKIAAGIGAGLVLAGAGYEISKNINDKPEITTETGNSDTLKSDSTTAQDELDTLGVTEPTIETITGSIEFSDEIKSLILGRGDTIMTAAEKVCDDLSITQTPENIQIVINKLLDLNDDNERMGRTIRDLSKEFGYDAVICEGTDTWADINAPAGIEQEQSMELSNYVENRGLVDDKGFPFRQDFITAGPEGLTLQKIAEDICAANNIVADQNVIDSLIKYEIDINPNLGQIDATSVIKEYTMVGIPKFLGKDFILLNNAKEIVPTSESSKTDKELIDAVPDKWQMQVIANKGDSIESIAEKSPGFYDVRENYKDQKNYDRIIQSIYNEIDALNPGCFENGIYVGDDQGSVNILASVYNTISNYGIDNSNDKKNEQESQPESFVEERGLVDEEGYSFKEIDVASKNMREAAEYLCKNNNLKPTEETINVIVKHIQQVNKLEQYDQNDDLSQIRASLIVPEWVGQYFITQNNCELARPASAVEHKSQHEMIKDIPASKKETFPVKFGDTIEEIVEQNAPYMTSMRDILKNHPQLLESIYKQIIDMNEYANPGCFKGNKWASNNNYIIMLSSAENFISNYGVVEVNETK